MGKTNRIKVLSLVNKQALIMTAVIVITSALAGGAAYVTVRGELDRVENKVDKVSKDVNPLFLTNSLQNIDMRYAAYCSSNGQISKDDLVKYAKSLPGIGDAKLETEDNVEKFVFGYTDTSQETPMWADTRMPVICVNNQ